MTDQKIQINRENVFKVMVNGKPDASIIRRPPPVNKVDGRARILRPLRPARMNSNQQPTTSTNNGNNSTNTGAPSSSSIVRNNSSGNMHHSQSMPVLQAGNTTQRISAAANQATRTPLPPNTTDKNAIPLIQWAEAMKNKLDRLRQKANTSLESALKEITTTEDFANTRDDLSQVSVMFNDLIRSSVVKVRYNAIFEKRSVYKAMETAIQEHTKKDVNSHTLFDRLQESMQERNAIEKNILAVSDMFRLNTVHPQRSIFAKPPPVKFSKHTEEGIKGFAMAMDAVVNRTKGDVMSWKFRRISHQCFRNSKSLVEVQYCARRPSSDKEFVTCMKAILILKFGILEDLIIGGEDETLFDSETIYHSKRKVYEEFTRSARENILCQSVTKFTVPNNVVACNNYIQSYVNCFSNKCYYCKKHLRHFMPPTVVTRESLPIIYHRLCFMAQVQ